MSKRKTGKHISGDPRKRSQRISYSKTVSENMKNVFSERFSQCSTYDDLSKLYIEVNDRIDRISDNPFKKMGKMNSDYREMSRVYQSFGFPINTFKKTVEEEINLLGYLENIQMGGTVYRQIEGEFYIYKKVC